MYRFSTSCLGLAALIAFACGAPAELDDSLFPASYADEETGSANGGSAAVGGSNGTLGGTGGAAPVAGNGGTGLASGSSGAPPVVGGTGGTPVAAGGSGSTGSDGCPDDITVLFNRPITEGGCAGGLCHQPNATPPDLVSPDPLSRLLGVASNCNGLPYIGATPDQSFLQLKITAPPMGCGVAMPFLQPEALSAEDEACILAWVAENAGG
jgi:hypothetical protein